MVKFQGREYDLTHTDVQTRMRGLVPEGIRKYFVAAAVPCQVVTRSAPSAPIPVQGDVDVAADLERPRDAQPGTWGEKLLRIW